MTNKKQWVSEILDLCKQLGYRTTPVFDDGKAKPFADGQDYKDVMSYKGCAHIGMVLDDLILVDYDGNKVEGIMSVDELSEELGEFEMPELIQSKEQSLHWLYLSDGRKLRASNDGWRLGVDIKTGNQLMHIKQSKELNLVGRDELLPAPEALYEALSKSNSLVVQDDSELGDFAGLISEYDTDIEEVKELLGKLDHNMPNSEWVKIGQALHHWNPVLGLELWDEWSYGGHTYAEGECQKRWKSFDSNGGVTLGTIKYMVNEVEYEDSKKQLNEIEERIKNATQSEMELQIPKLVINSSFETLELEILSKRYQERFKELTGVKLPISEVRALLRPKVHTGELVDESQRPKWCRDWVYVNSHNVFAHTNTGELCKSEAFNVRHGKFVPLSENGGKQSAVKYVSDNGFVDIVSSIAYLPTCENAICELEGKPVLNSFKPWSVPKEAEEFSEGGLGAIELVKKHLGLIFGSDEDVKIMEQWMAFQVQHQGEKLLWAPVIQSIEGVGKSFFRELMQRVLGHSNVGVVSPSQAVRPFNGWATGVTLNVLEEIRIVGHSRYDAVNALKPLITDDTIQIKIEQIPAYRTLNTTNYICFTNFKDAIPMSSTDRRWWIIFSDIDSLDDMQKRVGELKEIYFPRLFNAMRSHADELRKWLLEYPISEEFLGMKQAPMTAHKELMISTEKSTFEGVDEVQDLIEKGSKFYDEKVVSSSDLFSDLMMFYPEITLGNRSKTAILKHLGYMKFPKRVRIGEDAKSIWVKNAMSFEDIKSYFD